MDSKGFCGLVGPSPDKMNDFQAISCDDYRGCPG